MIRWLLLRFLIPLFVILIVRSVIMTIVKTFNAMMHSPPEPEPKQAADFPSGGELKKDPVCGTYVSEGASITKRIGGEMLHFCSVACRDKYRAT
jgi:YHS domain-containing protein